MDVDLTQPADALWIPIPPVVDGRISGGEKKHFAELRDAIVFIMENLEPRLRGTAWITTAGGSFTIEEITELHQKLYR